MVTYRLQRFPNVCAHCLRPNLNSAGRFTSIREHVTKLDGTVEQRFGEVIGLCQDQSKQNIAPDHLKRLLPACVCAECVEALFIFHQYQRKLRCVRSFCVGLAELKYSNSRRLVELFADDGEYLLQVLQALNVCGKQIENATLAALLDELPSFELSAMENDCGSNIEANAPNVKDQSPLPIPHRVAKAEPEPLLGAEDDRNDRSDPEALVKSYLSPEAKTKTTNCSVRKQTPPVALGKRKHGTPLMGKESRAREVPRDVEYMKKKCIPKRKPMEEAVKHEADVEMLKCPFEMCEHMFPNEGTRRRHIQKQHQLYECQICGNEQPSFAQHKRHMERHQQSNPLQCVYCRTAFEDRNELADHLKQEHVRNPDIEWQCDDCGMVFRGSKHVSRHRRLHLSDRMFACPECPMTFKTLYHMRRHHEIIHQDLRYQCTFCDKDYSRRDILRAHLEVAHNFQSYFYCSICLATFETDQDLQRHQERHRKPRPLECGTCLQEFLSVQELAQHLCITYRESYVCCGKDFRQHRLYNHHMLIRHGMKVNVRVQPPEGALLSQFRAMNKPHLHQCENCDERFEKKVALRQHLQMCRQQANAGNPLDMLSIELLCGDEQPDGSIEPTVKDIDGNGRLEATTM